MMCHSSSSCPGILLCFVCLSWVFCGCWQFTSSVPVTGGTPAVILSHSQKNVSNPEDNAVNEVPRESGAVSNRFNPVSGLEPGSPAAPGGPISVFVLMATATVIFHVWPLNCDPRGSLAALDVISSPLLRLGLVRQLVVSRHPHQTHLQTEGTNVRTTPMGAEETDDTNPQYELQAKCFYFSCAHVNWSN